MAFLNIINQVKENTSKIISKKGYANVDFVVEYSRSGFGDITCNVAFLLAKDLKKNPHEIAHEFAAEYNLGSDLEKVEAHKAATSISSLILIHSTVQFYLNHYRRIMVALTLGKILNSSLNTHLLIQIKLYTLGT